jgi:DNA-binding NarL/FixJ family response regulator
MPNGTITTVLVEDHELVRLGLKMALKHIAEVSLVAEVADGASAVDKTNELHPDLVLMDIGLPGMDGIEATRLIKRSSSTKVIIVTSHDGKEDLFAGLSAGADAYCLKGVSASQLANCIRSVMEGAVWLDPGIAKLVLHQAIEYNSRGISSDESHGRTFGLSEREIEILTLVVEGLGNHQIADRLFLSPETVKTHLRHVMEKLCVSDRTQAAVKAVRQGLVK